MFEDRHGIGFRRDGMRQDQHVVIDLQGILYLAHVTRHGRADTGTGGKEKVGQINFTFKRFFRHRLSVLIGKGGRSDGVHVLIGVRILVDPQRREIPVRKKR